MLAAIGSGSLRRMSFPVPCAVPRLMTLPKNRRIASQARSRKAPTLMAIRVEKWGPRCYRRCSFFTGLCSICEGIRSLFGGPTGARQATATLSEIGLYITIAVAIEPLDATLGYNRSFHIGIC